MKNDSLTMGLSTKSGCSFCFLVLHYKTIDETLACIRSIKEVIGYPSYDIVVVDNGSPDDSGERLLNRYADDSRVTVLPLPENLGFARGNNAGFSYAKNVLQSDYICMLNSDVLVTQDDLCERVMSSIRSANCAVLGPKIVNADGSELGPHTLPGPVFLKKDLRDMERFVKLAGAGRDPSRMLALRRKLHLISPSYRSQAPRPLDPSLRHEQVVLEGCCLFFAPQYIASFDGLDDRTFLYHEEDLLYLRLRSCGMTSLYDPSISITHNSHATTRSLNQTPLEHQVFRYTHQIESRRVLLEELDRVSSLSDVTG